MAAGLLCILFECVVHGQVFLGFCGDYQLCYKSFYRPGATYM